MTGYTPAEQAIRAARGLPYATGADNPPAWHDTAPPAWDGTTWGGASDVGLPDGAVYGPPPAAPAVRP